MSVNKYNSTTGNLERRDGYIVDSTPTSGSNNPVSSGAVYTALQSKANTTDLGTAAAKGSTDTVASGSEDLVESGAVYTAINTAIGNAVDNLLDTNF